MDKRTTIRRLETLATFLETKVPRKHFDMGRFWNVGPDQDLGDCGTAACALGWGTTIPVFRKIGFRPAVGWSSVVLGDNTGCHAGADLFGITFAQSRDLFDDHRGDETPKQVARRIRRFVAELRV